MEQGLVKQRIWQNRSVMLLGPHAFQIHLIDAISQGGTVQMCETLIKPFHLVLPLALRDQRAGANNENGLDVPSRLQFLQNQSGFDSFPDADTIGDQHSRTVSTDKFENRAELVRNEINPRRIQRI